MMLALNRSTPKSFKCNEPMFLHGGTVKIAFTLLLLLQLPVVLNRIRFIFHRDQKCAP